MTTYIDRDGIVTDLNADYAVTGFSGQQRTQFGLSAAFRAIKPAGNWKERIDALLHTPIDETLLTDACVHFTGSIPAFRYNARKTLVRVTAAGYYLTIGA